LKINQHLPVVYQSLLFQSTLYSKEGEEKHAKDGLVNLRYDSPAEDEANSPPEVDQLVGLFPESFQSNIRQGRKTTLAHSYFLSFNLFENSVFEFFISLNGFKL
jgi:hypothetical protein